MSQTTEKAFETHLEGTLLSQSGWKQGLLSEWDRDKALFPAQIFAFLQDTQPKLWEDMRKLHAAGLEPLVLSTLVKELDAKGSLSVLRHGFKFYGKTFRLAYFKPAHGVNYDILALFNKNRLTVTRQVPCHPHNNATVDMLLSVNGLPVATLELKNPSTGQTCEHARRQYKESRDPRAPLFEFKKRALVHFAVDPSEVYMTTRLAKDKTVFLPFNRGSHPGEVRCGAGNPPHASGYPTGYFWLEVLRFDSFLEILGHFMFVERRPDKVEDGKGAFKQVTRETMVFPRYHQLDAVRKLIEAARLEGAGRHYLIQHSAGSGKTNSISWLSHRLASLHNDQDQKVFDCVLVISDRQILDRQLQDAIYQIEHAQGVVKAIDQDSRQLAEALVDGTKIVITTLQKFPFVLRGLLHAAGHEGLGPVPLEQKKQASQWHAEIAKRRYAIVVDEAHSSQTGEAARELKAILGSAVQSDTDDELDWEERLAQVMKSRGRQPNLSFFAFTATPKGKTLEIFGRLGSSGLPEAFHVYSMRQAIEESFILDVLKHYTTYKVYFRLSKAIAEDPNVPKKKAARALARFASLHPHNIEQKTEVIIEHFQQKVRLQLDGRAKAMVVTSSRLHAVRYMKSFQKYLEEHGYTYIRPLVAFSGVVQDPPGSGLEYTEPGMNLDCVTGEPISEKALAERFATPDYQILLVANKYQTGFDQPLLAAMYVDKRLDGVQAVQTLSRLNRTWPGKDAPFVLDFVNDEKTILEAFRPYYDATTLIEVTDPHQLETLRAELDEMQVYHQTEVEDFARVFYKPVATQQVSDHAKMEKLLQPAIGRYTEIKDDANRSAFREKLRGFVALYAFLSHIMPYPDEELEKLYTFGRFLLPHLPADREGGVKLDDEVALQYYRLSRTWEGAISLKDEESAGVRGPTQVGSGRAKEEQAPLSEIIKVLNERFGTEFKEEDRLFFEQIRQKAIRDEEVIQTALNNPLDKFSLGIKKLIEDLMIQRMSENDEIVTRYMDDANFQNVAFPVLARAIFESVRGEKREGLSAGE